MAKNTLFAIAIAGFALSFLGLLTDIPLGAIGGPLGAFAVGVYVGQKRAVRDAVAGLDGPATPTPTPTPTSSMRPGSRHTDEQYRAMQDIATFQSEHIAAITAELGLSYEAETETVLAAIRALAAPGGDR